MSTLSVYHRDNRILRGARTVSQQYQFTSLKDGRVRVTGGTQPYEVTALPDWSAAPTCTCPDHQRTDTKGYCKHIIAVLLRDPALHCQLLELFL